LTVRNLCMGLINEKIGIADDLKIAKWKKGNQCTCSLVMLNFIAFWFSNGVTDWSCRQTLIFVAYLTVF
jgi:hypothetical protein